MRERVDLKSPVREYRPPGSVRGAPGDWRPYLDREQRKPMISVTSVSSCSPSDPGWCAASSPGLRPPKPCCPAGAAQSTSKPPDLPARRGSVDRSIPRNPPPELQKQKTRQ